MKERKKAKINGDNVVITSEVSMRSFIDTLRKCRWWSAHFGSGGGKLRIALSSYHLIILFFSCFLASLISPVRAEVPVKFTYQGNLRQQGFLVTGQRQMTFRLYTSSDAVSEVWESLVYNVNVSTGVFRVLLEPGGIDWQTSLWLELEIEGTRLAPREEIASAPYAINSLLHSGKRYTTSVSTPASGTIGDLWYDSTLNVVKFYNGTTWVPTSGFGVPGLHAFTHAGGGSDAITSLGSHILTGDITINQGATLQAGTGSLGIFVSTNLIVTGTINPLSNLNIGGSGYSVSFASSVSAGWYYGNGAGLNNLNASGINSGLLSGDRIGNVLVSTHIVDGSIFNQDIANSALTKEKLGNSGCSNAQVLKWNNGTGQWYCADDTWGAGSEVDPLSVHVQDTLQAGTTFYVSSGTVNYFTVNNEMTVLGTARIRGNASAEGVYVDNQGNVGVGNINPGAKIEITGGINPGDYLMIIKSGTQTAAWLRKK